MALLWVEGFEGFGDTIDSPPAPTGIIGRKYALSYGEADMDLKEGRGGTGYCIRLTAGDIIQSHSLTTNPTSIIGVAYKANSVSFASYLLRFLSEGVGSVYLYQRAGGQIEIRVGSNSTWATLGTTTKALSAGIWHYIELKVLCDQAPDGTVKLDVDGVEWWSGTGLDTQRNAAAAYHDVFTLNGSNGLLHFDDLYFLDGDVSGVNDILGPRKVLATDPNGAGDDSDWTPSAGSNYENVDDGALLDEDTTYNETSTDAHQDLYTYEDLPATVVTIDGIQITNEARIAAGNMNLSTVVKTGTTTDVGDPDAISSEDYVTTTARILEEDPDTLAAWTPSGVNGAQFGVRANTP